LVTQIRVFVFLFILRSRSLWGSTAELVGVVALDISLKELSSALIGTEYAPKRLYKSGYAFVWDASEKGVIHKNYLGEHSASGSAPGGGAVDIARLDSCGGAADCSGSLSFVEQFQEGTTLTLTPTPTPTLTLTLPYPWPLILALALAPALTLILALTLAPTRRASWPRGAPRARSITCGGGRRGTTPSYRSRVRAT
jgi:hypothetical protein